MHIWLETHLGFLRLFENEKNIEQIRDEGVGENTGGEEREEGSV